MSSSVLEYWTDTPGTAAAERQNRNLWCAKNILQGELSNYPMQHYGIHWFRRDLRVAGNPALQWSWKEHQGRVLGLFCFDRQFLARDDFSPNRFAFFLNTLVALRADLQAVGGDLLVLDLGPNEVFRSLFEFFKSQGTALPASVSFNRDYEPFARERDQKVSAFLAEDYGLTVHTERDHLLIEPEELTKSDGGYYQVFTPFSKRWFELTTKLNRFSSQRSALTFLGQKHAEQNKPLFVLKWSELLQPSCGIVDKLQQFIDSNDPHVTVPIPPAGTAIGYKRLVEFSQHGLQDYTTKRDLPGIDGTSRLSTFFKNGSLTTGIVTAALGMEGNKSPLKSTEGLSTFLKEIAWREFYYHILFHHPEVEKHPFIKRYQKIEWENDEQHFKRWKEGTTGFPIVDAGMRQLAQTGWMHNRVRMIVASFLTKDLHIDWRWGERHFMNQLLDGDLAPNNGGWQWAASTGCDPQPYFRVFNPTLQSKRFDPSGSYIRQWIPELQTVSDSHIHEPHAPSGPKPARYPAPIVDHKEQKEIALELYRAAESSS